MTTKHSQSETFWKTSINGTWKRQVSSYGSKAQECRFGTTNAHLSQHMKHMERGLRMKLIQKEEKLRNEERKRVKETLCSSHD